MCINGNLKTSTLSNQVMYLLSSLFSLHCICLANKLSNLWQIYHRKSLCTMHNAQLHMCICAAVAYRYIAIDIAVRAQLCNGAVEIGQCSTVWSIWDRCSTVQPVETSLLYQSKCNLSMMHYSAKLWQSLISIDIINNWCLNHCHRHCLKEEKVRRPFG